ncbi:hypothetical protein ACIGZJ_22395 [Kitasatospora sp. NPDC052868]|uniref:hypothetical protein n=1 Tax=Kitasatospora sp. NPDC052868 TaxID=3364060 RepID=UPI0037C7849E
MDMIHVRAVSPPDLTDEVVAVVLIVVGTAALRCQREIWRRVGLRHGRAEGS